MFATNENLAAVAILAFATAIATNMVQLPFAALASPLSIGIMVLAAVGAFRLYPAVGLALFLLTAVLFFRRNAATLFSAKTSYGDVSIAAEATGIAVPYASEKSGPRAYDQFKETDPSNPMLGPLREGFVGASAVLDEPAGVEKTSDAAPVGSYPLDASARPAGTPEERDYTYRPDAQTGSNEFVRFGPQMDVKGRSFAYAT
jgi:hypothetical protein